MSVVEIKIPSPGESVSEVTISSWLKSDGDFVEKNDELFEIESDKATLSVSAEASGKLSIKANVGDTVPVGAVAGTIDTDAKANGKSAAKAPEKKSEEKAEQQAEPAPAPKKAEAEQPESYAKSVASPAAKKILEEQGRSASDIDGTGRGGRITKADALSAPKAAEKTSASAEKAPAPKKAAEGLAPRVEFTGLRGERREKLSPLRLKVAQRLVAVKNETAMLTTFNEVDMTAILNIRKSYKEKFNETHGVRLGFMSFFTKAVTEALKFYPAINAFIDNNEIVYHDFVDVGVAVQAPKGLVVPVLRNAESMTLYQIEAEIERLAARARNNQLTIDEMTGGTFTISNGGVFGSLMSTPILNPPQSGILGMHKVEERPIAVNGQVVIRPMMYVAFSYDHRIIDGRESVGFLVKVKEFLEDPVRMLLEV